MFQDNYLFSWIFRQFSHFPKTGKQHLKIPSFPGFPGCVGILVRPNLHGLPFSSKIPKRVIGELGGRKTPKLYF
uniref:Uncharacterized protein n=1 Tax=Anguilla anguilla TaxID=7936 RepID=A0A0E9UIP9_ANGAN